jgi:hypothetical protein
MTIQDFSNAAFSITMQGNQSPDKMTLNLTSNDGSTFVATLNGKLEVQPNVGGFMSRTDATLLQAYLVTVLG